LKKLPLCTLCAGALFVVVGTIALFRLTPRPEPFGLLFPLLWDLAMVGIGLGIVFRCECARKAGIAWSIFCIIATLVVGGATLAWTLTHPESSLGRDRLVFLAVTIAFGVLFGLWQLLVLRSTATKDWTAASRAPQPEVRHG
jgi:hypothetical protein